MLLAVNYHYVRPEFADPYPAIFGSTPDRLRRQIESLRQLGELVSQADILAALAGEVALPPVAIVLTFDDGLREQYDHAWPILKQLDAPGIFFLNTRPILERIVSLVHKSHLVRAHISPSELEGRIRDWATRRTILLSDLDDPERARVQYRYDSEDTARVKYLLNFCIPPDLRDSLVGELFDEYLGGNTEADVAEDLYMSPEQVAELAEAGSIGSHAHEHHPLAQLSAAEELACLNQASVALEDLTGKAPLALSYPYGTRAACSDRTVEAAEQAGYRFAFTTERAVNASLRSPLSLARYDSNDVPGGRACTLAPEQFLTNVRTSKWGTP